MNRKTFSVLAVGAVLAVVTGCSSEAPKEPEPTPTVSAPSREQGAAQYERLVEPFNDELEKCSSVLNPLLESGESTPTDFPKLREACKDMPEANRTFADELSKAKWPAEAQNAINQLVDEVRADQLAWQEVSEVRTHEGLIDPEYPLSGDGEAAGLVRAHLGLPPVEDLEE